ncbi:TonB-dependent receptor [Luteimonas sp. YGD11-2]|uniref:TonB-dependent receptor n=1 Tax=Luteimonas sp. YGD11-2 TaxID=2508168 RepID=UPI00100A7791|nr:TonB-dependent receptor [Luteimonas sp. YGD11-2]
MTSRHPLPAAIAIALAALAAPGAFAQSLAPPTPGMDATDLDRVVVHGQYESQMRAIDFKRASDAIQDTVSADSMGQYPDQNVGESLSRLPGISVTRDQGEGRYVVIRGLDAAQNSVMVDGVGMGTPEDSSRAAPLDVIPSDSTERLTVIKAPTPDLPGDSLGGTILVESASAFDRDGRNMRLKAELDHQTLSGETSPKAAFNFSDIYNGTFGVAFGVSWQDRDYESDNIEVEYDDQFEDVTGERLTPVEVQRRKYQINRERTGVNLNLDWRPDNNNQYYLRTLFTDFTDAETRQNQILPVGEGDIVDYTGDSWTVENIAADDFGRRLRYRTKEEDNLTMSAGGMNRVGQARFDYQLGYTKARERVDDEIEMRFEYLGDDDVAIGIGPGRIPAFDVIDPAGGDAWLRNANYGLDRLVIAPKQVDDDSLSAKFDVSWNGDTMAVKAGVLGRWRDRDVNVDEAEYRRGPDVDLAAWTTGSPGYRHGDYGDGMSSAAMRRFVRGNRGAFSARPQDVAENTMVSLVEDYTASEDVLAGYLMGTRDIGNLRVIAGARVERTEFDATGWMVDLDADGELTAAPTSSSSSYTSVLPGLHLRYDTGNDWVLRGAVTKTIARPTFGDISPRVNIHRDDGEVSLGNPQLDPYESLNVDLSFERYLGESGIFSAGIFHKSIDGYIVETWTGSDPQFPGYDVTRPVNGEDAEVLGVELNWQQKLDFLPGAWSGLLVGLSGTWLDTEFVAGTEDRAGETFALPLSSERLYSAHIGWENDRLSTRLAVVHRSEYLDEIGDDARYDLWVAPNTQLDFSLDYSINNDWSVYLEAANLLDRPLEVYQGSRDFTVQNELYGRSYALGVKFNF